MPKTFSCEVGAKMAESLAKAIGRASNSFNGDKVKTAMAL